MTQEKRNKMLMLSLVVLLVGLGATLFLKARGNGPEVDQDTYRQADLRKINKVMMESEKGKVSLEYVNNTWKVNNSFPADRTLVEVLFATLKQAEPRRPVAGSQQDSIARILDKSGVRVSLFSEDAMQDTFIAGGNSSKTEAWFMKPGEVPHVMTIPGYRVYVSGIFELPAPRWREKLVFDFNWQNFRDLQTRFLNEKGNFEVRVARNVAVITGINEPDTARLNTFLDQLSLLTVEEYLDDAQLADSLSKSEPVATFEIHDIADRRYELKVYPRGKQFFALLDGTVAILDDRKIIPLLRPKEFFVKR